LSASGPAGCCPARPRPSRGGQTTPEGGGAAGRCRLTGASTRSLPGPGCHPGRRPVPEDLPRLLGLLAHADRYLHGEVKVALHPTLTRVWSRTGRAGQRLVQAPGKNFKRYGFGLVDWRDGHLDFALADGRRAAPLCAQLRRAADRSAARGRVAMVILDNLGIHTPKGSQLVLVYTPTYDPDANRIEWLWRALRRSVTHTHQRQLLQDLVADAERWAHTITPAQVLSQIGSPFAPNQQPAVEEELDHAA
jgi:DDE superfamily endonuclease